MAGPLSGIRVVELAGLGPTPHGVMLLADLGADVVRVDRPAAARGEDPTFAANVGLARNRRSIAIDLKDPRGVGLVLALVEGADVLVEGFRPGVAERLGLGPDVVVARAPRIVYARMTGWGQDGPLAPRAGHDIDYLAIGGALATLGPVGGPPVAPVNYLADFGGGGTFLAIGVLAALLERSVSGHGQVVDVAMIDGVANLTAFVRGLASMGAWTDEPGTNLLDGGAPFYTTYRCADGGAVAVGALEPAFYAALLAGLGMVAEEWPQFDATRWPDLRAELERRFGAEPRDHWARTFAEVDACVVPVLGLDEAVTHPHNVARATFVASDAGPMPAPAPRFSRGGGAVRLPPPRAGEHTDEVLAAVGLDAGAIAALRVDGVVA